MSDVDPPDDASPTSSGSSSQSPPSSPSEPPSSPRTRDGRDGRDARESNRETRRSRLESVIPEILKRAVEIGVEKARESPENLKQFVHDLKVPKEITHYIFQQIDDTKNGLFRVVAKEIRDFLEHTNFGGELQKILTTVQFEVNTTIRFTPNDTRDRKGGGGPEEGGSPDDAPDGENDGNDSGAASGNSGASSRSSGLPRPEVKTAVRMRREGRDARDGTTERRRRSSRTDA